MATTATTRRTTCMFLFSLYLDVAIASFGLETAPLSQAVQTNSSVHLTCGPRTHAHISWVKGRPEDGMHSLPSDERVNATGGELDIVHFHARDHEGLYFCVANDTNGLFRSCPARITHARIHSEFLAEPPVSVNVPIGQSLLLNCRPPSSNPPATVSWKKGMQTVTANNNNRVFLSSDGSLYVLNSTELDSGTYVCLARNSVTSAQRRSRASSVNVTTALPPSPPSLLTTPTNTIVTQGDTVFLECATNDPNAVIHWRSSNYGSQLLPNMAILASGTLVITGATPIDNGVYTCMLMYEGGLVANASATVTVHVPPTSSVSSSPTQFPSEGTSFSIRCHVESTDTVTVALFKGSSVLQSTVTLSHGGSMVTFRVANATPADAGLYQCMAYNELGCSTSEIVVTVIPAAPTAPTPTEGTDGGMTATPTQSPVVIVATSSAIWCQIPGDIHSVFAMKISLINGTTLTDQFVCHLGICSANIARPMPGHYLCSVLFFASQPLSAEYEYGASPLTTSPPTASPPPPTPPPPISPPAPQFNISLTIDAAAQLARCTLRGDFSSVSTIIWYRGTVLLSYTHVLVSEQVVFEDTLPLQGPGTYKCMAGFKSGVPTATAIYSSFEPSISPSPATTPPTASTTVPRPPLVTSSPSPSPSSVSLYILRTPGNALQCYVAGAAAGGVTLLTWTRGGRILATLFVTELDGSGIQLKVAVTGPGTYTCTAMLGSGGSVTASRTIVAAPSSSPVSSSSSVPLPSPDPSPTVSIRAYASEVICSVSLPLSAIAELHFYRNHSRIPADEVRNYTTVTGETFAAVSPASPGHYFCYFVLTTGRTLHALLNLSAPTTPLPVVPPLRGLSAVWVEESLGSVSVSWLLPESTEGLLGYKLNWGPPAFTSQVSRVALAPNHTHYTIPDLDVTLAYSILVWPYDRTGDQSSARFELQPLGMKSASSPSSSPFSSSPSPSPSLTPFLSLDCASLSSTSARVSWKAYGYSLDSLSLTYGCEAASTHTHLSLSAPLTLRNLLPNCLYHIHIISGRSSVGCTVTTPPGKLDIPFKAVQTNGSIILDWKLPQELLNGSHSVVVEVNVSGEWVQVEGAAHVLTILPAKENYFVYLRISAGRWQGVAALPVTFNPPETTATPTETTPTSQDTSSSSTSKQDDVLFLYGTVLLVVLLACVTAVTVILLLKYVQLTRRDADKVTDRRLRQKEEFRKMSLKRSILSEHYPKTNGTVTVTNI